jgi:hypothetical protein
MFICVVLKYAVYKNTTIHKSCQLGVKITSTHTGRDTCFVDVISKLLALLQNQLLTFVVEGKIFLSFQILIRLST